MTIRIGLAVGGGTGPELADIFERALGELAARHGARAEVARSPRVYRTYWPVAGLSSAEASRAADDDAAHYVAFVRDLAARGVRACFRTAFNAQALYLVRDELLGVKIEPLPHARGEILLFRDETQGFYSGRNDAPDDPHRLRRETLFSRENTRLVLDFALRSAAERWGGREAIDRIVVACKFHLLDNRYANWVREFERDRGVSIQLYQPDTTNRHLLRDAFPGRTVLVGSNEWADIMHAELITRFGLGNQDERGTRNVYLRPDVAGFVEYQTVHGSADDIGGRDLVNPAGTLRVAAQALEDLGGVAGAAAGMERALGAVARRGIATPDAGGTGTTTAVVAAALAAYGSAAAAREAEVLIVVDMQNDFLAPDGRFARLGLIDPDRTAALAEKVDALIAAWRAAGRTIVFVRTHADSAALPPTLRERHERSGRAGWLLPDSHGAAFFRIEPRPGESVFTKAAYDPFLDSQLERHLRRTEASRLVLAGAFTDVCIDALARTAFQKGYRVAVVSDATLPLRRAQAESLDFMRSFYDADVVASVELFQPQPRP